MRYVPTFYMHKRNFFLRIFLYILAAFFLLNAYFLVSNFRSLRQSGLLYAPRRPWERWFMRRPLHVPSLSDIETLQSWMSFEYLNDSFQLTPEYLKTKFSISSTLYPRISIRHAAKLVHKDEHTYLEEIKKAVREYLQNH